MEEAVAGGRADDGGDQGGSDQSGGDQGGGDQGGGDDTRNGVVADGYIRDARVYVDVDGDGDVSEGDKQVGVTDKDGKFSAAADAPSGALLAVGGVNTDTGVPNTLVLRAPSGSSVVNPLTTLVQAVI